MVYGTEALILVDAVESSFRFRYATEGSNDEAMSTNLELLDERREAALVQLATQKLRIERYYKVTLNTGTQTKGRWDQIGKVHIELSRSSPKDHTNSKHRMVRDYRTTGT